MQNAPVSDTSPTSPLSAFSPPTRAWFDQSFDGATRVQALGWEKLVAGDDALLVAPTGSGKTLAAFLWAIDRCAQLPPDAEAGVRVLYVSPLKALAYDIERNLRAPLVGIQNAAQRAGEVVRRSEVHVRTGDTPSRERAAQTRRPKDIVVTTPESLFLMLGSQAATTLDTVEWVIVDEIHVFAPSKRGVHLSLSLERLAERTRAARDAEPQRIGLSATVKPADQVAAFLGGDRPVTVVDASEPAHLDLRVRIPVPDLDALSEQQRGYGPARGDATAGPRSTGLMGPYMTAHLREIGALPRARSDDGLPGEPLLPPDPSDSDGSPLREQGRSGSADSDSLPLQREGRGGGAPETSSSQRGQSAYGSMAYPKPAEQSGIWPTIYPELIELILQHRTTIVFTNSRGLCERLSQRLNELWADRVRLAQAERLEELEAEGLDADSAPGFDLGFDPEAPIPDLVSAHHGSVAHARRAEIEEALKAGRLPCIVATSSLELGIDMGTVDLVVLVESPGSVARGLQRVGRAGHGVGELSRGVIFPKFKGDLLECAVVSSRMLDGTLEPIAVPRNPLDVLAQQIAAMCVDKPRTPDEILALVRRAHPYRELSEELLVSTLDMLSGRFPSDDFADLRPRLSWDRSADVLTARRGTKQVTIFNAGTIPDRGLFSVHLGPDGPRIGELDEEMVYESRAGDVILLGASSWRILEITRDRVVVQPAPGEPGRMPFWHGDGPGRPIELGKALGEFLGEMQVLDAAAMRQRLATTTPLDDNAISNLISYLEEQKEVAGALPTDRTIVVERFRDELGDWRICLLTPFGSRVHAPWAMALQQLLTERAGFGIETMYTDDGVVLRLADSDELPDVSGLFPDPEEVEDLVVDQVGSTAMFATHFRENASRALLLPRRRAQGRTPLWLARLRSKTLLASVRRFSNFPIVLETYRECLRDLFDVPALADILRRIQSRDIKVVEVETESASPFARSLVYAYIAQYLYEQDSPIAERKAQALTLDRNLLRELVGQAELRELLDPIAIAEVEAELQALAPDRRARDADELHDLLRRLGDLTFEEMVERSAPRELGDEGERATSHSSGGGSASPDAWIPASAGMTEQRQSRQGAAEPVTSSSPEETDANATPEQGEPPTPLPLDQREHPTSLPLQGEGQGGGAPAASASLEDQIAPIVQSWLDTLVQQRRAGAVQIGSVAAEVSRRDLTASRDTPTSVLPLTGEDAESDPLSSQSPADSESLPLQENGGGGAPALRQATAASLRHIAADDAGRYRDALGTQPPRGLPLTLLEPVERALESLIARWARTHGPFLTGQVAERFALTPSQVEPVLEGLERSGALTRGEIRPGGTHREWCDVEVLRRIKRRTLARLRGEVAPVDASVLARFLPRWHGLEPVAVQPPEEHFDPRNDPRLGARPAGYRPPRRAAPDPERLLDEALDQLEGAALPWSSLSQVILPARVPGFTPDLLDLRAAAGEIVWVGRGALGPSDGRIAIYRRDSAAVLAVPPSTSTASTSSSPFRGRLGGGDSEASSSQTTKRSASRDTPTSILPLKGEDADSDSLPLQGEGQGGGAPATNTSQRTSESTSQTTPTDLTTLATTILHLLSQRGACFTTELHQRLRREHEDLPASELEETLWDLVWAGAITNDTFLPLRTLGAAKKPSRRRGSAAAPLVRGRRSLRGRLQPAGRASRTAARSTLAGGRWALVEDLLDPERTDTEWAFATANLLLERHGVISRETALAEEIPGAFAALYPTLRAMEDARRVRRGYFVEGLSGRQFALAGAVERLREVRGEAERSGGIDGATAAEIDVLAALDPANPYGAVLPWPDGRIEQGPRPRRVAGAWIVLVEGDALGFVESGLLSVVTFRPACARAGARRDSAALTAGLREVMRRERRRSLRVGKVDGEDATASAIGAELAAAGWEREESGWRVGV